MTPLSRHRARNVLGAILTGAVLTLMVGAITTMLVDPPTAIAAATDRRMANNRVGVSVEAPAGWSLSRHTGYSDTIALLLHPDGSRISVTATTTTARDAADLYEQSRPGLASQGWTPSVLGSGKRGSFGVDLGAAARPDKIRQLYFVRDVARGRQALVLTLVCRTTVFATRTPALEFVAARLTLDEPAPATVSPPPGSTSLGLGGRPGS